ncbi:hypothetical protein ABZ354_25740 [Streptomyces sp. NPDC005925]|uniref:hypothetical protein n=1 Tax=Streptomyces sp. NPDC005925 TaxID=3157172 RepID=UPI0033D8B2CA
MRTRTTTAAALAALTLTLTACDSDTEGKSSEVPPYKIVQQDTSGDSRDLVVEVESIDGGTNSAFDDLHAVFNNVADRLTDEADYRVSINCSTGGAAKADNRLANGTVRVDSTGTLKEANFGIAQSQTCPKA